MSCTVQAPAIPRTRHRGGVLCGYLALIKPRVIELLLVTTIPAMFLAARGVPSPWLVLTTLLGGIMAVGLALLRRHHGQLMKNSTCPITADHGRGRCAELITSRSV